MENLVKRVIAPVAAKITQPRKTKRSLYCLWRGNLFTLHALFSPRCAVVRCTYACPTENSIPIQTDRATSPKRRALCAIPDPIATKISKYSESETPSSIEIDRDVAENAATAPPSARLPTTRFVQPSELNVRLSPVEEFKISITDQRRCQITSVNRHFNWRTVTDASDTSISIPMRSFARRCQG